MKRTTITLALLALTQISTLAQDWDKFGLKGKVLEATVRTEGSSDKGTTAFTEEGELKVLSVETAWGIANFSSFDKHGNNYTGPIGTYNGTATLKQGRIGSISFSDGSHKYVGNSTYGSNGFLQKTTMTVSWTTSSTEYVQSTASIDDNGVRALQEKIRQETDPAKKAKLMQQYQAAVSGARVNTQGGYTREKRQNHSQTYTRTYYNYKTDEFGNWTSRSFTDADGHMSVQTQTITYDPDFISSHEWNRLQQKGDLNAIEAFARLQSTTHTYRELAKQYWNERILTRVGNKQKYDENDLNALCAIAFSPIATTSTQDKALAIVRTTIYNEQVVPETDYQKVRQLADRQWDGNAIFDQMTRDRILARSEELRNGVMNELQQKVQTAFDQQQYSQAIEAADNLLAADPDNAYALDIKQEAAHRMLVAKEKAKTITELDYVNFIKQNPTSKYVPEAKNQRALLASKLMDSYSESQRVRNLETTDEATRRTVLRRCNRQRFKEFRGQFFRMGFSFDGTMGPANASLGAGLSMRFGYFCSWVNVEVGAKYNYLTSTPSITGGKHNYDGGFLDTHFLSVPVDLHINFARDWDYSWYLGLGAELGVAHFMSYFREKEPKSKTTKNNDIAYGDMRVSPKLSIGYTGKSTEVELFALYDNDSPFDKDYVTHEYGPNTTKPLDKKSFDKQIVSDKFIDKCRFGLALRFLF